jgi:hypothetical protein
MRGNFGALAIGALFLYVSYLLLKPAWERRKVGRPLSGDGFVPGVAFGFLGLVIAGAFLFADT